MSTVDPASATGWAGLFWTAFRGSRNPMVLLDNDRRQVEVNGSFLKLLGYPRSALIGKPMYEFVAGGALMSRREWLALLGQRQFTGRAELVCADGHKEPVEFAGHPEIVTGRQLVLFVTMQTGRRSQPPFHGPPVPISPDALSARELEVVRMIALGLSGPEIAGELGLSHNTVRTHARNAMSKANARSRAHLVAVALAEGWTRRPET
jgi:PAS domain S-box-containing protein